MFFFATDIKKITKVILFIFIIILSFYIFSNFIYSFHDDVKTVTDSNNDIKIVINLYERILYLYINGEIDKRFPVAIGKSSTKTPVGEWAIVHKSKEWGGGFGSRWLGLNVPWGKYGIHGTNKPWLIGNAVSHGCIRMYNKHVETLYELVPLKTRVKIIGRRLPINVNKELRPGQTGLAIMQLQDNLKNFGFDPGYMDARFGPSTKRAIKELEAQFNLKIDGYADWDVIYLLDLPGK